MKIAGKTEPHESARGHVTGEAHYTDDLCFRFPRLLHAWPVCAPHAHALVKALDTTAAFGPGGVIAVLTGHRDESSAICRRAGDRRTGAFLSRDPKCDCLDR